MPPHMRHTTTSKADTQWARLRIDVDSVLRRGAWYRVLSVTPDQVSLSINAKPVLIARDTVELRRGTPSRWTVLVRPTRVTRVALNFHDGYVVCPSCRNRLPLPRRAAVALRCPRCNVLSDVGWDELYLKPSPSH
jgi:LSD1 subclass zinc finger protein